LFRLAQRLLFSISYPQNHTASLLKFLGVFTTLYPTSSPRAAAALPVYQKLMKLVEAGAASPGKFLTDKIINLVGKSRPGPQVYTRNVVGASSS